MLNELFYKGNYGIERETMRVDGKGRFAATPHPFDGDDNISKDYCENQLEIITPVCKSIDELMKTLGRLDASVREVISGNGEHLWLYSNPPYFEKESEIRISSFTGESYEKRRYFEKLERRYGKRIYTLSGVHFNFSFDDAYLHSIYYGDDFEAFKFRFYLKVYKQLYVHSWLPLILTAASPVYDRSLWEDGGRGAYRSKFASVRNGESGYWNKSLPILSYANPDEFLASLEQYVNTNLFSIAELYLPVRLKPRGTFSVEGLKKGVSHIEFRMLDINPFESLGIDRNDLEFIHLLTMYLSVQDELDLTEELQREAIYNHKNATLYDLSEVKIDGMDITEKADMIIKEMSGMFVSDDAALRILEYERGKLSDRLCTRVGDDFLSGLYPQGGETGC